MYRIETTINCESPEKVKEIVKLVGMDASTLLIKKDGVALSLENLDQDIIDSNSASGSVAVSEEEIKADEAQEEKESEEAVTGEVEGQDVEVSEEALAEGEKLSDEEKEEAVAGAEDLEDVIAEQEKSEGEVVSENQEAAEEVVAENQAQDEAAAEGEVRGPVL